MKIDNIMSFLTYPGKHIDIDKQPIIEGVVVSNKGDLYNMLFNIFKNSEYDCKVPISFILKQPTNPVRDDIIKLISSKHIRKRMSIGKSLAGRLQCFTNKNSGIGLVFFIIGSNGENGRIVISRFPAQEGISAKMKSESLKVEHVEQIFIKGATSYKSVMYEFQSSNYDLWPGIAVDKQVNDTTQEVATYWIKDFLCSDFLTRSKRGTKILALAMKRAIADKNTTKKIRQEIISCANLANNITGEATSINGLCDMFRLSEEAKTKVLFCAKPSNVLDNIFSFDKDEFNKYLSYKAVELDNGAILSARRDTFDKCFKKFPIGNTGRVKYVISGKVRSEELRGSK